MSSLSRNTSSFLCASYQDFSSVFTCHNPYVSFSLLEEQNCRITHLCLHTTGSSRQFCYMVRRRIQEFFIAGKKYSTEKEKLSPRRSLEILFPIRSALVCAMTLWRKQEPVTRFLVESYVEGTVIAVPDVMVWTSSGES